MRLPSGRKGWAVAVALVFGVALLAAGAALVIRGAVSFGWCATGWVVAGTLAAALAFLVVRDPDGVAAIVLRGSNPGG